MNNSSKSEDKTVESKLKTLGYEKTEFQPKISNRFIVKVDGLPSHIIKRVILPTCDFLCNWYGWVSLELYNPVEEQVEKLAMELIKKESVTITVHILNSNVEIDTTWVITGESGEVLFGEYNWEDETSQNLIVRFEPVNVNISY